MITQRLYCGLYWNEPAVAQAAGHGKCRGLIGLERIRSLTHFWDALVEPRRRIFLPHPNLGLQTRSDPPPSLRTEALIIFIEAIGLETRGGRPTISPRFCDLPRSRFHEA